MAKVIDRQTLKRVFIVGFPRSGTTWMMWLLARLPSVVALQHSGLFHALRDIERWWQTGHAFTKTHGRAIPSATGKPRGGGPNFDQTTTVLTRESYNELIRPVCAHVFDQIASANPNTQVVVEQTPENMEFERSIRGMFPDARDSGSSRCLLLHAQGRPGVGERIPGRPIHIANRWNEYVARAARL